MRTAVSVTVTRNAVADQPPRHRVSVAINLDRAIRADTPDQLARGAERRDGADRVQRLGFRAGKKRDRRPPGCAVNADLGHFPRPGIEVRLQGFPGCKAAAGNGVFLHITDAVLGLAFGASPIRRTRSWSESPVLGKGQQLVVEHHAARDSIMIHNQCPSVVEQNLIGYAAKPGKGALQARKPALLALVAECANVQST